MYEVNIEVLWVLGTSELYKMEIVEKNEQNCAATKTRWQSLTYFSIPFF